MSAPIPPKAGDPWKSKHCTHVGPCPGQPTLYQGEWWNGLNVYPHNSKTGEIL